MRKLFAALLLSSALVPVAAHADPDRDLRSALAERIRENRQERAQEPRPEPVRVQRVERAEPVASPRPEPRLREVLRERGQRVREQDALGSVQPSGDSVREWRVRERLARQRQQEGGSLPGSLSPEQAVRDDLADRFRERDVRREAERRKREARPPVFRDLRDRVAVEGFRRDWRRDRRYDWRGHRNRHRDRFHLGWYYDPFGWDYRRWQVGWNIRPHYWSDRYWLRDPWQWRLPTVYGPYRWIRYYDDALLVDLRSGRIVDVIYDVFW